MAKLKDTIKRAVNKITGTRLTQDRIYDYSTKENRENTVAHLFDYAKAHKSDIVTKWTKYDDYYNNKHVTQLEIAESCKNSGIPWIPAIIPDPFIHVESQIISDIPDFQFNGRDDDLDSEKAKQREYVVKYVMENNKIETMNTVNERRLNKLGNAIWKVCYDWNKEGHGYKGDIVISDIDPVCLYPDPAAKDIDDCEFVDYTYRLHRRAAARIFREDLQKLGKTIDELSNGGDLSDTNALSDTQNVDDDTVQILEHWYKDDDGDIALSIMIDRTELRHIPKYWVKTGRQNKLYPFVKYCKIPDDKSFWDKSELASIIELVDAEDRELAIALLNDAMMGNDIIIQEENAMADDCIPENRPGATWKVKSSQINNVRRLGGLGEPSNRLEMIHFIREVIQETIGNFDSAQGKEPIRVTTASGIAQLNERADARKNIKKADRLAGFERLFELVDWTALEFYDDNRMIFIGAKKEGEEPVMFNFNSDNLREKDGEEYYYPRVDAVVNAGDGLQKSKAFTLSALENLLKIQITPENYKIVIDMVDIMDLPNKKEIKEYLEGLFGQPQMGQEETPQDIEQLKQDVIAGLNEEERAFFEGLSEVEQDQYLLEILEGSQNGTI